MEFNKIVSLVLGFIVLILAFVWISNRVRSSQTTSNSPTVTVIMSPTITPTGGEDKGGGWNPFGFLFNNDATKTPTPSLAQVKVTGVITQTAGIPTTTPVKIKIVESGAGPIAYTNNTTGSVQQIPATGVATILIPLSLAAMSAGIYLRKRS